MSKISVIRLVNIRYNDDRMVIPDQVFFCGGKSTLIHLRNGGGKSVMTQLMCAPFLPKRYRDRDTRLFSSYFRQSAPSFILLEWELEGGAGRLLTGMMVHHTARNEEEGGEPIEMVNFIAQYDAQCAYDILSLPIFEEQDGGKRLKKFADCRAAFESFRKERGASFFLYDMAVNAQSRQYFDKLLEYGINTKEWSSIIRQVNRQEGGLSHFFDDCRSEKDLIIRKFLPAIESRLDTEGTGQIAQFRENIGKFTESYFNNLEKVKRRESFLHFQETGSDLEEKSGQVLNMEAESGQRAGELARLALDSETEADAVSGRLEKAREKLEDVQNRRYQIDHQELSQKAYHTMDERDRLLEEQAKITAETGTYQHLHDEAERTRNLQECARLQDRLLAEEAIYRQVMEKLEVARAEGDELEPEHLYLGWVLKSHYTAQLGQADRDRKEHQEEEERLRREQDQHKTRQTRLHSDLQEVNKELGQLEAQLKVYDERESAYAKRYNVTFVRNMFGRYNEGLLESHLETLEKDRDRTEQNREEAERSLLEARKREKELEETARKLLEEHGMLEREHDRTARLLETYETELEERRRMLRRCDLDESLLYEKQAVLDVIRRRILELEETSRKLMLREQALGDEISTLETGRTVAVPEGLQRVMDKLDMDPVYGMQWLKENRESEETNLRLVREHPFLPYALLMTDRELEQLSKYPEKVTTSSPIPIVTRTSLKEHTADGRNDRNDRDDVSFYMHFDESLLTLEGLRDALAALQKSLKNAQEERQRIEEQMNQVRRDRQHLDEQAVTKEAHEKARAHLLELEQARQANEEAQAATKTEKEAVQARQNDLQEECHKAEERLRELEGQIQELRELMKAYQVFLEDLQARDGARKRYARLVKEEQETASVLRELEGAIQKAHEEMLVCVQSVAQTTKELAEYSRFEETARPESMDPRYLSDMASARARYRAILEKQSGAVQELEERLKDARNHVDQARRELERTGRRYDLEAGEWQDIRYMEETFHKAESDMKAWQKKVREAEKSGKDLGEQIAARRATLEGQIESMREKCGTDQLLPREKIPVMDFEAARRAARSEEKTVTGEINALQERQNRLRQTVNGLMAYREYKPADALSGGKAIGEMSVEEVDRLVHSLLEAYHQAGKLVEQAREALRDAMDTALRDEKYQLPSFQNPLRVLQMHLKDTEVFRDSLDKIRQSYALQLAQMDADLALVDSERRTLFEMLLRYVQSVHEHMDMLDRESTIFIRDRQLKMLKIRLPSWEENEKVFEIKLETYFDEVLKEGLASLQQPGGKPLQEILRGRITIQDLYDAVVPIASIRVQLYKMEEMRSVQIQWSDVANVSGGETFLSAFVVLSCLLAYMRRDTSDVFANRNEGKVLIMDNPFGATNGSHLLIPMMKLAEKTNTQLICLTGLNGESIYDRFDNLYVCRLAYAADGEIQYLEAEHAKGEEEVMSAGRISVETEGEQLTLF